jgi:hypothetical protein
MDIEWSTPEEAGNLWGDKSVTSASYVFKRKDTRSGSQRSDVGDS